jgi:hypothetical protein
MPLNVIVAIGRRRDGHPKIISREAVDDLPEIPLLALGFAGHLRILAAND